MQCRLAENAGSIMKNRTLAALSLALLALLLIVPASRAGDAAPVVIHAGDQMKFDVTTLQAAPGQKITITLTNNGTLPKVAMAHNWVLLKAGTDVSAFAAAGMTHQETGYLPPEMAASVIAGTKLLGPGESDTITFTAPAAGVYDYICTFPGHALAGMRGTLTVK
jgi:azurin